MRGWRCALLLALVAPITASAHPHAWISVQSTLVVDASQNVTAIRQQWVFDEYYTQYVQHDVMPDMKLKPDKNGFNALAHQNLKNLKQYNYFTTIETKGAKATYGAPTGITAELKNAKMHMRFTLPLAKPLPVKDALFYRIYDPSYYAEMLHGKPQDAAIEGASCTTRLQKPNPTLQQTSLATALDRSATAPDNMGAIFAQTVHVECP